jgi:MFS family permease
MGERFSLRRIVAFRISSKRFLSVSLLVASNLSWFLVVNTFFYGILTNYLGAEEFWADVCVVLFYGSGAFFALIGSTISARVDRRNLLASSILLGILASALMVFFQGTFLSMILSILFGFSVGFGLPSAFAFLADSTEPEERGRVTGLVMLTMFILTLVGIATILFSDHALIAIILFFAISRSLGLISLAIDKCERAPKKEITWKKVVGYRDFALYMFPWIFFCLAVGLWDWSASTLSQELTISRNIGVSISLVCMALSGIVAGTLADRFGRKQPIAIALVLIGISLALVGLVQIPETIIIYYLVYGIAWGFLFTLYVTIQGDFAPLNVKEKFYALGTSLPLLIFMGSSSTLSFLVGNSGVPIAFISPILSAIIFLSIIPIWRANETLAASKIGERNMKEHIKKVEKIIEDSRD